MSNLFISYAREDRDFVAKLVNALKSAGHEVWWDRHLEGGDQFRSSIEQALDAASASIVVWSERSRMSRWVNDEAEAALQQSKVIPVRIDGCRIPLGFSGLHTLDFRTWDGAIDAGCMRALFEKLNTADQTKGQKRRPGIPTFLSGVSVAGLLAILFGIGWTALLHPNWSMNQADFPTRTMLEATLASLSSALFVSLWAAFRARRFAQANIGAILFRSMKTYGTAAVVALVVVTLALLADADATASLDQRLLRASSAFVAGTLGLAALIAFSSAVMYVGSRLASRPN